MRARQRNSSCCARSRERSPEPSGLQNALVAGAAPRERTGYAMGLLQVAAGAGLALGPLIGGASADAFGYGAAFYVTALLLTVGGIVVVWGVRDPAEASHMPAEGGFRFFTQWRAILVTPGVVPTYALRFINQLGRMIILPVLPLLIRSLLTGAAGVHTFTGIVVGAASAAATFTGLSLGRLGDRIGHRRILVVCTLAAGGFFLPQAMVTEPWQLLTLYTLAGAGIGGIVPAISALLAGFTIHGREGAVYGLDNSVSSAARVLAPMVGVAVASWLGLRATFIATGLIYFTATVLALRALPPDAHGR